MADKIVNTQIRQSDPRYMATAERRFDPLYPTGHDSIVSPLGIDRKSIDYTAQATFGSTFTIKLPQINYVGENFLEVQTVQVTTTANWSDYLGLSLIRRFVLKNSVTLQEFDYLPVMEYILSNMSNDKRNTMLRLLGGTGFQQGKVLCPLPVFWSQLLAEDDVPPLPVHLLNSPVEMEITFRDKVDVLAAGTTPANFSISSVKHHFISYETSDDARAGHLANIDNYIFKGYDFQTISRNAVANATLTNVDLSAIDGDVVALQVQNKLQSDINTAKLYFKKKKVDALLVRFDGTEYNRLDSELVMTYDDIVTNNWKGDSDVAANGDVHQIPFGIDVYGSRNYSGSINTNDLNQLSVDVTHTAGAATYVDVLAVKNARYIINNRHLVRLK